MTGQFGGGPRQLNNENESSEDNTGSARPILLSSDEEENTNSNLHYNDDRQENVIDNALDQYIEDLREANKQADLRTVEMVAVARNSDKSNLCISKTGSQSKLSSARRLLSQNLGSSRTALKIMSPVRKGRNSGRNSLERKTVRRASVGRVEDQGCNTVVSPTMALLRNRQ